MRRSGFTFEAAAEIIAAKGEGKTHEEAAAASGVLHSTLRWWLRCGRKGEEPYATFVEAFSAAEHLGKRAVVERAAARLRELVPIRAEVPREVAAPPGLAS